MKCVVVFLSISLLYVYAGLIQSPAEVQLFLLQLRVRFLTNKLYERCPELIENEGFLRERASDSLTVQQNIEIELQIYKHVLALMTQSTSSNQTQQTQHGQPTQPPPRWELPQPPCCLLHALHLLHSTWLKARETTGTAQLWVIATSTFWSPVWHGSASLKMAVSCWWTHVLRSTAVDIQGLTGATAHYQLESARPSA